MKAKDIMSKEVITLNPDDTAALVAEKFLKNNINGAPVMDDEKVVGFVSEKNLVNLISEIFESSIGTLASALPPIISDRLLKIEVDELFRDFERAQKVKIKEIMTKKSITILPETLIEKVAEIMCEKDVNHLPVVDEDGKLVGIVAREDIIHAIAKD